MFPAFQGNVAVYLVSIISKMVGDQIDLERIWKKQELSTQMKDQIKKWAEEVNEALHKSANGRMISEWAKKPECWSVLQERTYSKVIGIIPEFKQSL
jgi:hypothetical protein